MNVRVTGVLIEDGKILLLNQDVENTRNWSLPGGKVEPNETLEEALKREIKEETGLEISLNKLLYVCDHITTDKHILHITFLIERVAGVLGAIAKGLDTNEIRDVKFVPVQTIQAVGFSQKFQDLIENDFPNAGSYMGPKSAIGL
jgi:mutator protein MutT